MIMPTFNKQGLGRVDDTSDLKDYLWPLQRKLKVPKKSLAGDSSSFPETTAAMV